ncbi:hypothetical protein RhiirC2_781910 [Rhizophagus irregularis]|uniref:Uncharacterized protein n=1 Tax=Rhizophagus irregularis TaxID=588596 RepID=A0A2N1N4C0_9GLOM|nr:hypothetical protein RhiirC2_781910 [Rhizophagus irregularis]
MNEVRHSVYFLDPMETSGSLYDMIQKGEFVALYCARASGKSTRMDQAMFDLERRGMFAFVNMKTIITFWSAIAINVPKYFKLNDVKSADDFIQNKYLPLNVKEPFRNQNFTLKWSHYEDDAKLTIVPEVIKDIYEWTNGHAGLVCFCGKAISSLEKELDERRCLDFVLWSNFVASLQPTVRFFYFIQIHDLEEEDKQIS